jgi:cell division septal protein FtsQ
MRRNVGLGVLNAQPMKRKKHNKTRVYKNTVIINSFIIILIITLSLLSPVFAVREITVNGTNHLSADKIIESSNVKLNSNIFIFRTSSVKENIDKLAFVKKNDVIRVFPNRLVINVVECKPIAQVLCGKSLYIVVDESGKILDTTSEKAKYAVPVIEGVVVEQFEVSKKIVTNDEETFDSLILIAQELYENMMVDKINKIYIDNSALKISFLGGVNCDLGSGKNISYRIRFIKEVFSKIPKGARGVIEFIEEYKAVFKPNEE